MKSISSDMMALRFSDTCLLPSPLHKLVLSGPAAGRRNAFIWGTVASVGLKSPVSVLRKHRILFWMNIDFDALT